MSNQGTARIVKPIEMQAPRQVRRDCRETGNVERWSLKQRVRSRLLFTNEQTGRQSGDGDWSKGYNRKKHRVWILRRLEESG